MSRAANAARVRKMQAKLDAFEGREVKLTIEMFDVPTAIRDVEIGGNVVQMLAAKLPCFSCRREDAGVAAVARFVVLGLEHAKGLAGVCGECKGRDLSASFAREFGLEGFVMRRAAPGGRA